MTPQDYERMWLLFEEAKQKQSTERGAFLEERCSGNSELCREVVRLLARTEAVTADFLARPILCEVAFAPPSPSDDPLIGKRVGLYEIRQRIGSGGMGEVYLGKRVEDYEQRVAVKLIKHGLQNGEALRRFQDERQVLAALSHPHIARLLDGGSLDGRPYLVMEYLEGQPIDRYCQTNQLTLPQRLGLFRTVCAAVQYAHQNLVLHRDLKPENILVGVDGAPRLVDFGIAKLLDPQAWGRTDHATRTGHQPLTPGYASPEQIRGREILTTASDVYSLGVVLYELLTGHRPHEAAGQAEYELARRVCEDEPTPPRRWRPELPRDLEAICLKCLRNDPDERYQSAAALADDLRRFQEGRPTVARPVGRGERLRKWVKRQPAVVALLTVSGVALLALGGIGVSLWYSRELAAALKVAKKAKQEVSAAQHLAQARAYRSSGQVGQRWKSLDELASAAGFGLRNHLELRNEAIACLALPDLRLAKSWDGWLPGTKTLVFDSRLERYARSDEMGNLGIHRVSDGVELKRLPGPGTHAYWLRFSPDGKFVAALYHQHSPGLYVWDWRQGQTVLRNDLSGLPDFSPDSRQLVLGEKGSIRVFDLGLGKEVKQIASRTGYHACAFDPGGRRLAVVCHAESDTLEISEDKVAIYDVAGGRILTTLSHKAALDLPIWSPDGHFLVAASWDRCLYVWDADTGKQQAVLHGSDRQAIEIAFNRRGNLLASTGWDGILRLWDPRTGRQLLRKEGNVQAVQFSQDDRLLAWTRRGSLIELWEVTSGAACRTLSGPAGQGEVQRVDFSPDGRFLASTSYRGVYLWRLNDSRQITFLDLGNTRGVAFHPRDGSLITCSERGVQHWPIQYEAASPGSSLRIDTTRAVLAPAGSWQVCLSSEGRTLGVVERRKHQALLLDLEGNAQTVVLPNHPGIDCIALSPDGRWAATGTWYGGGARVWETNSGKCVCELPGEEMRDNVQVAFSGNGRWLVTGTGSGYRLWEVGSWQPGPSIPTDKEVIARLALAREGTILAVTPSPNVIRLLDLDTLRELATLQAPDTRHIEWLCFSRDSRLLAAACENQVIQVWDLHHLRQELATRGLDWHPLP